MMNNTTGKNIIVSVCMITYNHESIISQAIEGVLMQKTSFPIELIIGEDCSTDSTRKICLEYKNRYPDIIRLNLPPHNIGPQQNFLNTYDLCTGKYVALCEGDDYWIDPEKLQKQVDFMEKNPDFSMSTHHSVILGHNKKMIYNPPIEQSVFTTKDIIIQKGNIMTASFLFRKEYFSVPDWFKDIETGDYLLQLLMSLKGKIGYMPEYMSVYRRHLGGATAHFGPFYSCKALYKVYDYFNKESDNKYKKYTKKKMQWIYKDKIEAAHENNFRRQEIGIRLLYYFSRVGIDIFPVISRIRFFTT